MKFETKKIGPTEAQKMLENMAENRTVSQATVERYAHDMRQGNWRFTGEPIIVDLHGRLLDGQHRLWAVVETNQPQMFLVVSGIDPDAMWSIDMGRSRNAAQILHMQGMKYAMRSTAIARTVDILEFGGEKRTFSVDDFRDILDRHKGIEWIVNEVTASRGPFVTAGVLAAFAIAREKYPNKAQELWETFKNGANLAPNDPILVVRDHLATWGTGTARNKGSGREASLSNCRRVLTALAYKMRGEPMAKSYDSQEGVKMFLVGKKRGKKAA